MMVVVWVAVLVVFFVVVVVLILLVLLLLLLVALAQLLFVVGVIELPGKKECCVGLFNRSSRSLAVSELETKAGKLFEYYFSFHFLRNVSIFRLRI